MPKRKEKIYKLRLTKSTEIKLAIKSSFVLPRALRPLCNKSLLKKALKTPENIMMAFLNLLALGFEIEHAARQYPNLLITEGLEGVSRHEREREAYLQKRIVMQLKRRRLIEEQRLGNRLIYRLTIKGEGELLKKKIYALNMSGKSDCLVIFDFPETQHAARDTFRRFLRECRFQKLQQSVWSADKRTIPHVRCFIEDLGLDKWVKIVRVKEIL